MKVLCIDAKPRPDAHNTFLSFLKEGETYTIEGWYELNGDLLSYYFKEIPGCIPHSNFRIAYAIVRFIPLQDGESTEERIEDRVFETIKA
jgi:hypothetical protein